jgi:hypothetical protein
MPTSWNKSLLLVRSGAVNITHEEFLLLRWGETLSLWNWAANGPTVHPPDDTQVNMEQRWNDTDRGKRKDLSSATLSTTNPTWTDLRANPGLRAKKPATNRLSYGTAYSWGYFSQHPLISKSSVLSSGSLCVVRWNGICPLQLQSSWDVMQCQHLRNWSFDPIAVLV